MGVQGDFRELDDLIDKLGDLESGKGMKELSRSLAEEALDLVAEGFDQQQDPYGKDWAELRSRDGRILQDTGALRNSFHVAAVSAEGFTIAAGVWYAVVHQEGAEIVPRVAPALVFKMHGVTVFAQRVLIPPRPMLPRTGDLPPRWRHELEAAADDWFDAFFSR